MPRYVKQLEPGDHKLPHAKLIEQLTTELASQKPFGQPIIDEKHAKNGSIRVNVFWDEWSYLSPDERSAVIVEAYRNVEGDEFVNRIGLLNGLTIPEGHSAGLLPYEVFPAVINEENEESEPSAEIFRAMTDEGASTLNYGHHPVLRFGTEEEAEACKERLIARLPGSKSLWKVIHEFRLEPGQYWDFSDI